MDGDLTMDADQFNVGAAQFGSSADTLRGHALSVGELAALRAAFAGAGEAVWPAVEARLTELVGRLENAQERTTHAGTLMRTAADGSTAIDQKYGKTINR